MTCDGGWALESQLVQLAPRPRKTVGRRLDGGTWEALAEARGHWAHEGFPDAADPDVEHMVCKCGLPWSPGVGCVVVDGIRSVVVEMRRETAELKTDEDRRWDIGIDWLLNNVDQSDFTEPVYAFVDGIITEQELRDESTNAAERNRRRSAHEASA